MDKGTAQLEALPTDAQLKVLVEIHRRIKHDQIAPSFVQVASAIGITKSAVAQAVTRLRRDGFLVTPEKQDTARYRNHVLTPLGKKAAKSQGAVGAHTKAKAS